MYRHAVHGHLYRNITTLGFKKKYRVGSIMNLASSHWFYAGVEMALKEMGSGRPVKCLSGDGDCQGNRRPGRRAVTNLQLHTGASE